MLRSVLAAALLIPLPVCPANLPLMVVQPQSLMQVVCYGKDYISSGTAFRVGPRFGVSVNHVTSSGECYIDGKPIVLAYKSPTRDFSEVLTDDGPYLTVDCGGFVKGRRYLALGYARGEQNIVSLELTATGVTNQHGSVLTGMVPVIPGMSGGAVLDEETGRVVGTVNMENFEEGLSWSVPLSDTPICAKKGPIA